MKVKARDVVEGWPRGRTTSTFVSRGDLSWSIFLLEEQFRQNPNAIERQVAALNELAASIRYHQNQQRMVTAYLERWRLDPDGCLLDLQMWPEDPAIVRALRQQRLHPLAWV